MKCFCCLYFESHRCRNEKTCPPGMSYVEYTGSTVRQCLEATTEIYQDGYIHCAILESVGCERCMERFGDGSGFEPDEDQNYERKPRWQKENGMRDCGLPKEVESQCCLNRGGMCTLDTADFGDIDRAVGMRGCGFIGVNDRYLLWKYGVPYKDLVCGSCGYYEAGEHSWGICTNETIKPHPKGFTENGEKKYTESKEYYNGAHACGNFVKRGSEKVAKKKQPAPADLLLKDVENLSRSFEEWEYIKAEGCQDPFWPDGSNMNLVRNHICNFKNEIESLCSEHGLELPTIYYRETPPEVDMNYMARGYLDEHRKPVREYLKEGDCLPKKQYWTKCGRKFQKNSTASVTGYELPFDVSGSFDKDITQEMAESFEQCISCPFRVEVTEGWGEDKKHIRWECRAGSQPPNQENSWRGSLSDKNTIKILSLHHDFLESVMEYCRNHPELGAGYNQDEDDCRRAISVCCSGNKKGIVAKKELIAKFFPEKAKGDDLCEESLTNTGGKTGITLPSNAACEHFIEKGEVEVISENQLCIRAQKDCTYFCKHNKGCSLLLVGKRALPELLNQSSDIDCDVFRKVKNDQNKGKNNDFLPENVTKTDEFVIFDYSSVDEETGAFLQEKANNILQIRTAAMIRIAKELSEAHDILANNKTGTFTAWCRSIGYLPDTAQNYVRAYKYIAENFGNIEDAENIQPSLLFAVSKPSARPELQQAVLAGDIKTHKEYKELEEKFHEAEARANEAVRLKYQADSAKIKAESEFKKLASESANHIKANLKTIHELNQQLDQAKRNSDPAKVQELGQIISEKQREIEALRQQLKDKPIEATASRVVEKLPDDVQEYLSSVNDAMRHMQNFAKVNQVLNLIVGLSTDELQSWAMMMNNRKAVGDDEEAETLELLSSAIQSLEDMKEDYENRGCED